MKTALERLVSDSTPCGVSATTPLWNLAANGWDFTGKTARTSSLHVLVISLQTAQTLLSLV